MKLTTLALVAVAVAHRLHARREDHELRETMDSLAEAEAQLGTTMKVPEPASVT